MKQFWMAALFLGISSAGLNATVINFTPFVSASSISAQEGQDNTIGFTYAGNKFVGSVYFGSNNAQLYQTDLTGKNVQLFGSPVPGGSSEIVLGGALGLGGFTAGTVFAGTGSSIYEYANSGGTPTLFATGFNGTVRQILFDPSGSFGGNMLVTTTSGNVYTVSSGGVKTVLASVGEDTEGMDIATSAWGPFAGDLLVDSEGSGNIRLISPGGVITLVGNVPSAETVSFVPLNLGASGNPVEGFYVANYPVDIQYAGPSQFAGLLGDAIVTSEDSSNARLWDVHYNGASSFTITRAGNLPNQSEDGIFVTAQRISESGTPEPSTWATMCGGLIVLCWSGSRRLRAVQFRGR